MYEMVGEAGMAFLGFMGSSIQPKEIDPPKEESVRRCYVRKQSSCSAALHFI